MQITWYGENCFKITSGQITLLVDPFSLINKIGFRSSLVKAEIILLSSEKEMKILKEKEPENKSFLFFNPGEYEIKNIFISGLPYFEKKSLKIIYLFRVEGVEICFLGEVSQLPGDEIIEKLAEVEILFISLSREKSLKINEVIKFIHKLKPKIVIPTSWSTKNDKFDSKLLKQLTEEMNQKKVEYQDKLKIKKKDLLEEKTKLVILKSQILNEREQTKNE